MQPAVIGFFFLKEVICVLFYYEDLFIISVLGTLLRTCQCYLIKSFQQPGEWASLDPILKTGKLRCRELMAARNQLV